MEVAVWTFRHAGVVISVLLACALFCHWRRDRNPAGAWAALAFGSLSSIALAGMIWPELVHQGGSSWIRRALIAVLIAFPWFLYRFASALEGVSRRFDHLIDWSVVALVAVLAVVPYLPAETDAQPAWWVAYRVAASAQWLFIFAFVGYRFWRAGRGQPEVPRKRMRTLALASALIAFNVLLGPLEPSESTTGLALGLRSLGLLSAVLLFVGFAPPQWLIHIWRRRDYLRIQTVLGGLLAADSIESLAHLLLPPCADMLGARGVALVDSTGNELGSFGDVGSVDDRTVHRIELSSGCLLLWMSPYAPFFGDRELSLEDGLGTFVDITLQRCTLSAAKRESARELAFQATHDALTGLPNRTFLMERLNEELEALASGPHALAIHFLDLDQFKVVNDGIDHVAGDALLVAVARRLSRGVREGDFVARFGGDEFVILSRVTGEAEALLLAERMATAVHAPVVIRGRELITTASVGVVIASKPSADAECLIRDADTAMYRAKVLGRARAVLFDEQLRERSLERLELERDLRAAVNGGDLSLHYQPEVRMDDGSTLAVEALFRWDHPRHGSIPAGTLIALAEESNLIASVGRWVLNEACRQGARWLRDIPGCRDLRIWVNVSPAQFVHHDVAADVQQALLDHGLRPENLGLEITESVFLDHDSEASRAFAALRELGVSIAIDDFGTGYSSLAAIKHFPADLLKIDGSFIGGVAADPHDEAIVAACVALAEALDMSVVAEAVETDEQRTRLLEMGCQTAQGYHFAPPLSAEDTTAYLRRHVSPVASPPVLNLSEPVRIAG